MPDTLPTDTVPAPTHTAVSADPLGQVARAQDLYERGPVTAVAAFFTIAFFFCLVFLLRAKDKHQLTQSVLQTNHAKDIAQLMERHAAEMTALYIQEKERAIKHEVTMSNFLDMMDDVRFIAFEMRRVKVARDRKRRISEEETTSENADGDEGNDQ